MKKTIAITLSVMAVLALTCCSSYEPVSVLGDSVYKSVVVIGIDGGGGLFNNGDQVTPEFASFFSTQSAIGFNYTCETPSISAQNWGSYLHGVSPDKLEVTNLKISVERFTNKKYPSVFQIIHNADPTRILASVCAWSPINHGLIETTAGVYKDADLRFNALHYDDPVVRDHVCEYLDGLAEKPTLLFVHFDTADEIGHAYGYGSPQHREALTNIQGYALDIFDKYDPETTLFIVVADHGGTPDGHHGKDSPEEMHIICAIRGKTINPSGLTSFMPKDLTPIILKALNISIPSSIEGRVPENLFTE
jgi:predicted AlkP superfamily pyrophosphatase or phosphodiesterase